MNLYSEYFSPSGVDPLGKSKGVIGGIKKCIEGFGIWCLGDSGAAAAPTGWIGQAAIDFGKAYSDPPGADNAMRHCFWQAMIASIYGQGSASCIGDLHELGPGSDPTDPEKRADSAADQRNNRVGRACASSNFAPIGNQGPVDPASPSNAIAQVFAAQCCMRALQDGKLDLTGM